MKCIPMVLLGLIAAATPPAATAQRAYAGGGPDPAAALGPGEATVQEPARFWGGVGLSIGTAGFGAGLDLAMLRGERLFSARWTVQGNGGAADAQDILVSELGVMYGRGMRFGNGNWGSLSGGIALVAGDRDEEAFETVGIPLQAQLISRRMPHLGATVAANLNAEEPFVSFILSLQLGPVP